jgi:hypothetical protein
MTTATFAAAHAALLCLAALPAHADNPAIVPPGGMYSPGALGSSTSGPGCSTPSPSGSDRFYADAHCEFSCAGSDQPTLSDSRELEWDPEHDPSAFRGDGNLWAGMTTRLTMKGSRACLEAAAARCGRLDRVASVRYLGMDSGSWHMPPRISCGSNQELFYSPYDPTQVSGLRRIRNAESTGRVELVPDFGATGAIVKGSSSCTRTITASVCFGDCLCEPGVVKDCPHRGNDERWAQVLGTSMTPARRTLTICADALVAELASANMAHASRDVLTHYCEDFAWRTIFSAHSQGTTCAAYRGTVDCASLF